ncbi:retron Ec48 family effector membrane protein [Raoultella ornithinolytica]|uniref:retron Ec48 family effector membrane protein n=1 Tax=Raoultella ornithinolytica TaxID=54291 RepID=UPI002DBF8941|nr:retron Ec48 family effector membrane protein [Raoultella ornithinolytica]MEB8015678.1 retron Ec48 family effector membrane protein [Raoultella ornithinolytica]
MLRDKYINADNLVKIVLCVCLLSTAFLLVSFFFTIHDQKLYNLELCIQSKCIDYLSDKITGVIKLAQFLGWLITLVTAIGGAIIALNTYVSGVGNSNITNHIAHFTMFRDYVNSEIKKRSKISPDTIDVHLWYNIIFPASKTGSLVYSPIYLEYLKDVKEIIDDANFHISDLTGKYKYQTHQRRMKDSLARFGIHVNNGPKNIFIEIEFEIFGLIDSVNTTFIDDHPIFCLIERKYS